MKDPWDPIDSLREFGRHRLTSVEFTVTNLCNMRCEHCAVGDVLVQKEGPRIPLDMVLRRLDEVEQLRTISITGGEPSFHAGALREYIVPLLKYAKDRGLSTQINTNLTLDYERYESLLPFIDVFHISYNYLGPEDFHRIGFANAERRVGADTARIMYERMIGNARRLADDGAFVSAESMINYRTHQSIAEIHRHIVEMGCRRHEVHPMYPSAFASNLPVLPLEDMLAAFETLLDRRDRSVWMLFGTLPIFACSDNPRHRELVKRLANEPNVTVRNDPDGRNRMNVNTFTGDVTVTDFSDVPPIGNIQHDRLEDAFDRWLAGDLQRKVSCYCPTANCCGPNLLVADMYYRGTDFLTRKAK